MSENQFEYEVDWFNSFEKYLKNLEDRTDKTHVSIKTNIIEANQSLEQLIKACNLYYAPRNIQLILYPSKETHFKNLELKTSINTYYFYIREENREIPRFWIIYNYEKQKQISSYIKSIFQQFYRQDCVYLSNKMMSDYVNQDEISAGGFSLSFRQSFYDENLDSIETDKDEILKSENEEEIEPESVDETELEVDEGTEEEIDEPEINPKENAEKLNLKNQRPMNPEAIMRNHDDLKNVNYSMRLWAGSTDTYRNIISKIELSGLPVNYKSLMCFFNDEDRNQILKEEFNYLGGFTINSGRDLGRHVQFVNSILQDYKEKMEYIENYRMNFKEGKGKLIRILLGEPVNRENFIDRINNRQKEFRLFFTKLYTEDNYNYYRVADLHNGDHFYTQVYDDSLFLNLHKNCCGNNVFRLYTNLQKHFSPSISLEIDGSKMQI
jgi:hypothetical protein